MLYVVVVNGTAVLTTPDHAEAIDLADSQRGTDDGATVYQIDGHPVHTVPPAPIPPRS